jgi:hypothetical protein
MEMMVTLFVGYFLYESDASNWWWTGFWAIIGVKIISTVVKYDETRRLKNAKEIEEQRKYWEGK